MIMNSVNIFIGLVVTVAILLSAGVIFFVNPVLALVCLIGVFLCSSIVLLAEGVTFLAYLYILVYVGAVAVLFLFVIMFLNIRRGSRDIHTGWFLIILVGFFGLSCFFGNYLYV